MKFFYYIILKINGDLKCYMIVIGHISNEKSEKLNDKTLTLVFHYIYYFILHDLYNCMFVYYY
jgi:hypothetical protein